MSIKVIQPFCNLETVKDGRGGIFTWLPEEPIVEFNLLFFKPGKTRGFHYHPHFIEYLLNNLTIKNNWYIMYWTYQFTIINFMVFQ